MAAVNHLGFTLVGYNFEITWHISTIFYMRTPTDIGDVTFYQMSLSGMRDGRRQPPTWSFTGVKTF
jgi:hypothetical protein